jgi:hypothetical protein
LWDAETSPFIDISAAEMLALPDDRRGAINAAPEIPRDGPPAGPPG